MIKKQGTILIVDDNRNILTTVRMLLEPIFDGIITIANPNSIPAKLREEHPDVVLLDMNFSSGINSGNEGLYWLREIKSLSPKTEVVLFTAYADIQLAVTGIKEGAADFIVKPFENEKMIRTLMEARDKNKAVDNAIGKKGGKLCGKDAQSAMYWGDSEVMNNLRSIVEKVAATDANILITGENGTGKEVLTNEIHRLSTRCGKKMLPVDMGAITETLFESELFGHVKGAFTDAKVDKPGKFELADGSTIFLDEIGNLILWPSGKTPYRPATQKHRKSGRKHADSHQRTTGLRHQPQSAADGKRWQIQRGSALSHQHHPSGIACPETEKIRHRSIGRKIPPAIWRFI